MSSEQEWFGNAFRMKPDEALFLAEVSRLKDPCHVRDLIHRRRGVMREKRAWYLLEKWSRKGWYNYGVCVDLGWMEPKGKEVAAKVSAAWVTRRLRWKLEDDMRTALEERPDVVVAVGVAVIDSYSRRRNAALFEGP